MDLSGWGVHGIVLGVLAGIAVVLTLMEHLSKGPSGGWISLRGILSFMVWIGFAVYAVASTITFALREYLGIVPSYLIAVPFAVALWMVPGAYGRLKDGRRDAKAKVDLLSRFELLSWSPETPGPGRLLLRAEIRALRDLLVRFHGVGFDAARRSVAVDERQKAVPVKAGDTARLEIEIPVTPDRPMVEYVLEFWTWMNGDPEDGPTQGVISYEKIGEDSQEGPSLIRRPLPPPGAR